MNYLNRKTTGGNFNSTFLLRYNLKATAAKAVMLINDYDALKLFEISFSSERILDGGPKHREKA